MEIRCSGCSGEQALQCIQNFELCKGAINDGAEATAEGGWSEVVIGPDQEISFHPLEAFSPEAMGGQAIIRSMFVNELMDAQNELGCTLSPELVEQKLSFEQ